IPESSGADRAPPRGQLARINDMVQAMTAEQYRVLYDELIPALAQAGIRLVDLKDLTTEDTAYLHDYFRKQVLPVLTPLAIDPGHPFPHLANKSHNIAILLQRPRHQETLFAVVQVPAVLPRFLMLPSDRGHAFVALETVIRMHLPELFLGMELV